MRRLALACWLWGVAGCAPAPTLTVVDAVGAQQQNLTELLRTHPLLAGENISALALGRTEAFSYHLIQIRDREQPHIHATHDLAVTLLRGTGRLYVEGTPHKMRSGDIALVPHGTPHYFVNSRCTPAVAFVTFAPPSDGSDTVPLE